MQQRNLPIGVFDSGIGGLTVASAIGREMPGERIYYFGDTARCPYGDRNPQEVTRYSVEICDFLVEQGVKMLVVACNTATASALDTLVRRYHVPVVGVIQPGAKAAVDVSAGGAIGVIGTAVTVQSGAYERAVKARSPETVVYSLACPTFVPLVEQGIWGGADAERVVRAGLLPLTATMIDTLILGCTHYPHLQSVIQSVMGPGVRLISSAHETAREVNRTLSRLQLLADREPAPNRYFTTGDGSKMRLALARWMGASEEAEDLRAVDVCRLSSKSISTR